MITSREPTILCLVLEYNKCCTSMEDLIKWKKVPKDIVAVPPQKIDSKKLFSLEVDDRLWQDVGLEDDTDGVPCWLGDEAVREGISAMLDLDRAQEELARVTMEHTNIQNWFRQEWQAVKAALMIAKGHCKSHICLITFTVTIL